jgi:hypothetical protein
MENASMFLLVFPHLYEVEEAWESSRIEQPRKILYFPHGTEQREQDGLILKIVPARGDIWFGKFAFGGTPKLWATKILSCPDPSYLCVISSGTGYIVDVTRPSKYERVALAPICNVQPVLEKQLLIFSNFTNVVAYDERGFRWKSQRLSSDGIEIVEIVEDRLKVLGFDAAKQTKVCITLDLESGTELNRMKA